jgi:hypothetical protein
MQSRKRPFRIEARKQTGICPYTWHLWGTYHYRDRAEESMKRFAEFWNQHGYEFRITDRRETGV